MQIIEDFLVKKDKGYYCSYGDFYIDPLYPVKHSVVSHAHGDHASPGHKYIYCTEATAAIMKYRYNKQPVDSFHIKSFSEFFQINGVELYFYSAGHILGSAQILMIYKGIRYLYTGDYKLQKDSTCEPLEFVEADVLITETTFANPNTKHPDPIAEIQKLDVKSNILLGCYALGKAQRITSMINEQFPNKEVLLHYQILPIHRIYDQFMDVPMKYEGYSRKSMKHADENKIYLVPPLTFNSYRRAKNVLKAFASGWERLQAQNDISLFLSDHVDWDDILHYVSRVKPKAIWTLHGDGRQLHEYFSSEIIIHDIQNQTFNSDFC